MKSTSCPPPTRRLTAGWIALCALLAVEPLAAAPPQYLGPTALVATTDGKTLLVANADARQLAWVEASTGQILRRLDLPAPPTGLVLGPDGKTALVACAAPRSSILVVDVASGAVAATIRTGHGSTGPAISPDGRRLYVCNRFDDDLSVIDLTTNRETARIDVIREPVAAVATRDGKRLLVANHLPLMRADAFSTDPVAAAITVVDAQTHETSRIDLPLGANGLRTMCLSADGRHAYVTHLVGNFQRLPTHLDLGWINMNVLTVIDTQQAKIVNTVGLDDLFSGAGNPWGVGCTADGKWVVVSHAGSHELTVLNAPVLLDLLPQMFVSPDVGAIPEYGNEPIHRRRRVKLPGNGPRGLTVVGSKVYVAEYFTDTLAVVDLAADGELTAETFRLGPEPQLTAHRRGERLFNDATICYQHWQSCASCHPDGRTDALNWDLLNDGAGNPKNTKSMLLAPQTPPVMAEGVRDSSATAVRAGMNHILFAQRPEEEARAIDEYIQRLPAVASPYLVDGRLSPAAERGRQLFHDHRGGCHKCHPPPLFTDLKMHKVDQRRPFDFVDRLDTPTLIEVWRTAPYLHDGRYTTVKELIVEGKHGATRAPLEKLTEQQIDDLVEFVLSL